MANIQGICGMVFCQAYGLNDTGFIMLRKRLFACFLFFCCCFFVVVVVVVVLCRN